MELVARSAHLVGIAPLVVMFVWGRRLPLAFWLMATGLAMSWAGDALGGDWAVTYWWLPAQIVLCWLAFCRTLKDAGVAMLGTGLVTTLAHGMTPQGPDVTLTLVGSWAILLHAGGPLGAVAVLYFGVGTVAYMVMAQHAGAWSIAPFWLAYQACRTAAVAVFARAVLRRA